MAILELDAVEKRFGGLPAVDGVTLGVDDGEILAVVGPNGAGKSTLLKLVSGLESPSGGAVRYLDEDVTGAATHEMRRRGLAMVLQTPRTFPSMPVRDNVAIGAMYGSGPMVEPEHAALRAASEALEFVGLAERAAEPVSTLNLHEQRFLELARAIAGHPRLLLLDEVMAGLNDTELAASIDIVRRVRDELGVTVIWVEHVMKAVMSLAERVVVMNFGAVLAAGRPEIVMRDPAVVSAYLGEPGDA